ncbi:restriction endonuclease subunit S [Phormidesmis priestleyi]|uniref:restriction endonuclease subunit S n=1 Tax=Phormidesmis priestleyi TaxID=268141 RepID=UPI00083AFA34|nr:restriction endonuclease subunit S [Phormidesmis priestleyi]
MPDDTVLLERHFDTAFAAPDGIQRLRELILTLAMQGKLVPQDPKDQPASELLKAIEVEKQRLVKEGKIKQPKPLPAITAEELPYKLPDGWEWVRLHDYGIWKSGTTPSRTNSSYYGGDIPWVKSGEVKQGKIVETSETITQEALKSCSLDLNSIGSVLVAMYGANIGEVGVLEIEATTNQAVCACKPYLGIDNIFLVYLLTSLKQNFIGQGAGAAQPNISREKIIHTIVPLPPLAEQRRIVAKIDRLMARCDELEKLRGDRNQKRITIHTAALNRLLTAKESSDFSTAWRFITRHFGELYSVKENVAGLRKAILQLAVMGKLVLQDPKDEPASELLEKVADERSRLLSKKEVREEKSLIPISDSEIKDLQIPNGWIAVHLGEVIYCLDYKRKPIKKDDRVKGEIPYYGANGRVGWIDEYIFNEPLVLVVEDETFIGRVLPFSYTIEGKSWVNNHAHVLKPTLALDIDFLNYSLSYYPFTKLTSGTTGRKKLNKTTLLNILYIFPPLAEQHRIVAKIDRLMALCDRLERQIDAATDKRTKLLKALMAQV